MALTDTFVRHAKHAGKPAGEKHTDGDGMYLLVKAAGKYWRMDYTYADKRKTLSALAHGSVDFLTDHAEKAALVRLAELGQDRFARSI